MDRSERIGLSVSAAGHVLLFAALSLGLLHWRADTIKPPPPMEVTLTDHVALRASSTSHAEPPAAEAPELGPLEEDATDAPPPPEAKPEPAPIPSPKPVAPEPKKAQPTPQPKKAEVTKATPDKSTPTKPAAEKPKPRKASRLGDDFLKGLDSSNSPSRTPVPVGAGTAPLSPLAARSLAGEINRQLAKHWSPPSGADAEQLVTLLSVRLDRNGNVIGRPEVIGQNGVTASNRAQASLHAERAIQAVMRASPFINLPPEYYEQWKWLNPLRFDARLAQ